MKLVVHCKRGAYDRYVGRGPGARGRWGNPFRIGPDGTREEVIAHHRGWLWEEIKAERVTLEELADLAGKVLGCWCAPQRCHGETIAAAALWAKRVLAGEAVFDRSSDEPPF
jgi:hypothetical protein